MVKRKTFESIENYQSRLKKEELEAATGCIQGRLESDERYMERARQTYIARLAQETGVVQNRFESGADFEARVRIAVCEKRTGIMKNEEETEEEYISRAMDRFMEECVSVNPVTPCLPSDRRCRKNRDRNLQILKTLYADTPRGKSESEEAYGHRACIDTLKRISRETLPRLLFESEEEYERRLTLKALEKDPEAVKWYGLWENDFMGTPFAFRCE